MGETSSDEIDARRRFAAVAAEVRPRLFRYCARMTGSVFDGEDVVQETLARAYRALPVAGDPPPLTPWIFRIAHNTAMDFLKSHGRRKVDLVADVPEPAAPEDTGVDDALVEAAITVFARLPPVQRSALVLKDVLGLSLDDAAVAMGTTVAAVKAALVRARANVAGAAASPPPLAPTAEDRANLRRYAALFNAHDWDGLRALLGEEAQLDLVSRGPRRSAAAAGYYTQYAIREHEDLRAEPGLVDGVAALAIYRPASSAVPAYFIVLEWSGREIALIRDFRYVPYIADGARFVAAERARRVAFGT